MPGAFMARSEVSAVIKDGRGTTKRISSGPMSPRATTEAKRLEIVETMAKGERAILSYQSLDQHLDFLDPSMPPWD